MQDYGYDKNAIVKTKFFSDVKEKYEGKFVSNNIEAEFQYSKRASRQIEDISTLDSDFVFLERNGNLFKNLVLNLSHLKLTEGGEALSQMVLNPTTFGESLSLYSKELEKKEFNIKTNDLICKIDQNQNSCLANITILNKDQSVMVPWESPNYHFTSRQDMI
jgi:hypothetical protein